MPPKTSIPSLLEQLEDVPVALIRRYFEYGRLAPQFNYASRDRMMSRIQRMLDTDELTGEQLREILIDLGESGAKHTYMLHVNSASITEPTLNALPHRIGDLSDIPFVNSAANPRQVYSYVSDKQVRLAFVETHWRWASAGPAAPPQRETQLRRVIFNLDRQSGDAFLALDPPSHFTPHGNSTAYQNFYRAKVRSLLGITPQARLLNTALENIDQHDLTTMKYLGARDLEMSSFTVSSEIEVRSTRVFGKVADEVAERSAARLYWKPSIPCNTVRGVVALQRAVRTDIDADTGLVRFASQTISTEVEYVLAQLRAYS
jgi:hypothetical protein